MSPHTHGGAGPLSLNLNPKPSPPSFPHTQDSSANLTHMTLRLSIAANPTRCPAPVDSDGDASPAAAGGGMMTPARLQLLPSLSLATTTMGRSASPSLGGASATAGGAPRSSSPTLGAAGGVGMSSFQRRSSTALSALGGGSSGSPPGSTTVLGALRAPSLGPSFLQRASGSVLGGAGASPGTLMHLAPASSSPPLAVHSSRDGFLAGPLLLYDCVVDVADGGVPPPPLVPPRPGLPMWAVASDSMQLVRFVPSVAPPAPWRRPGGAGGRNGGGGPRAAPPLGPGSLRPLSAAEGGGGALLGSSLAQAAALMAASSSSAPSSPHHLLKKDGDGDGDGSGGGFGTGFGGGSAMWAQQAAYGVNGRPAACVPLLLCGTSGLVEAVQIEARDGTDRLPACSGPAVVVPAVLPAAGGGGDGGGTPWAMAAGGDGDSHLMLACGLSTLDGGSGGGAGAVDVALLLARGLP